MNRWIKDSKSWKQNLFPSETLLFQQDGVRLDDGENKTSYSNGDINLTTHRLIWSGKGGDLTLSLSLVAVADEEQSGGFMRSEKMTLHLLEPPPNPLGESAVTSSSYNFVRLAFKNGGMKNFTGHINAALSQRKWQQMAPVRKPPQPKVIRSGIGGIEKNMAAKARSTDVQISKAFQDLDALMEMAKPMVALANRMSKRIREKQDGDVSDDETIQFKSYLMSMGISDPVTRETSGGSKQTYFVQLAKEIESALRQPVSEAGGMMTLTDAYVRINRARGLELISPEDLLDACQSLDSFENSSLRLHTFDNTGVKVLQLSSVLYKDLIKKTEGAVIDAGSITSEELAKLTGIAIVLAKERLLAAEQDGKLCRDDSVEGLRFYPNLFLST